MTTLLILDPQADAYNAFVQNADLPGLQVLLAIFEQNRQVAAIYYLGAHRSRGLHNIPEVSV